MNKLLLSGAMVCLLAFLAINRVEQKSNKIDEPYKEQNPREAYDALTFLTAMSAYPNADIPKDGYAKAWTRHKQMLSHPSTRTAWENLGPNNVGGRTVSIAIDPVDTNVVWLGSASGGLWKSTTGGTGVSAGNMCLLFRC
jgi:hypothetical protein